MRPYLLGILRLRGDYTARSSVKDPELVEELGGGGLPVETEEENNLLA